MSFLNKHFFAGTAAGFVLGVVATLGGLTLAAYFFTQARGGYSKVVLGTAPDLPLTQTAPLRPGADWAMHDLQGARVSLASTRGNVVFLNKWATWCGPCVVELPSIQALYDSLNAEGITFVLVSDETPEELKAFLAKQGFHVPVYTTKEKAPAAYKSIGIPATFVLDRSGNVMAEHGGAANWDVDRVRDYLRFLSRLPARVPSARASVEIP